MRRTDVNVKIIEQDKSLRIVASRYALLYVRFIKIATTKAIFWSVFFQVAICYLKRNEEGQNEREREFKRSDL